MSPLFVGNLETPTYYTRGNLVHLLRSLIYEGEFVRDEWALACERRVPVTVDGSCSMPHVVTCFVCIARTRRIRYA